LSSVVIKSANPAAIEAAVARYAEDLRERHPEIRRIVWFGSWVGGLPSPGSDVDLCLVVARSERSSRDRIPDYLPGSFPVGIDLFVYTEEEFARLPEQSPSWHDAISRGRQL